LSFLRLTPGHVLALVAALCLMLVTALDWYTTDAGEEARRIERLQEQDPAAGPESGQIQADIAEQAAIDAESHERNAWQASALLDRMVLLAVLAAAGLALLAATLRASGRELRRPLPSTALAGLAAALAALLLAYRMINPPGSAAGVQIEIGAPLALLALGAIALGSARGARAVEAERGAAQPGT
jgi:hypothetical protein